MAKATGDLSMAQSELIAINTRAAAMPAAPAAPVQPVPQQRVAPSIAPRALDWVKRNDWFDPTGKDERSREALHINQELTNKGVDPNSEAYTRELDKRLKAVYPDHQPFDEERSMPRRSNTVVDGGRPNVGSNPNPARTVELTRSELALAKRLGVTPQDYARSKIDYQAKLRGAQ